MKRSLLPWICLVIGMLGMLMLGYNLHASQSIVRRQWIVGSDVGFCSANGASLNDCSHAAVIVADNGEMLVRRGEEFPLLTDINGKPVVIRKVVVK